MLGCQLRQNSKAMCGFFMHMSKDGKTRPFGDRVDQLKLSGADSFIKKRLNNINMAFARLAIVDQTRRADQPFFGDNEEGVLLFNGEI